MMDMMATYFFTDTVMKNFIFKNFNIIGVKGFVVLCVVLFIIVVLFEGFKLLKIFLSLKLKQDPLTFNLAETRRDDQEELMVPSDGQMRKKKFSYHLLSSITHMVNMIIGYLIMLAFMTYSVWVGIAITLGSGLGYWLFAFIQQGMVDKYKNLNTIHQQVTSDHERDDDWYSKVNGAQEDQCHM